MDRGSYRASQPERRVINGSDTSGRSPEPAASAAPEPSSRPAPSEPSSYRASRSYSAPNEPHRSKRPWWIVAGIIVVLVVGVVCWWIISSNARTAHTAIDSSKYQAVLLSNGESYFGKLSALNDDFMKLTDIFYLKAKSAGEATGDATDPAATEDSFQLIKFGGEVQGPEDEMVISKSQILYYENLKPDGKASQAIQQYKKTQ